MGFNAGLEICGGAQIERRPRGASRVYALTLSAPVRPSAARAALRGTSPLPHLLQRGHACRRGVASLGARLETSGAAVVPTQKYSHPTKTDNHGLTGSARCNKCGSGLVPRSAARAALDLTDAESATANATTNTREAPRGLRPIRRPNVDNHRPYLPTPPAMGCKLHISPPCEGLPLAEWHGPDSPLATLFRASFLGDTTHDCCAT